MSDAKTFFGVSPHASRDQRESYALKRVGWLLWDRGCDALRRRTSQPFGSISASAGMAGESAASLRGHVDGNSRRLLSLVAEKDLFSEVAIPAGVGATLPGFGTAENSGFV